VNLEQPISDSTVSADKSTLFTGSYAVTQLQELAVTAVNLANNHIQDKNDTGILDTVIHVEAANIGHFGAGSDIECASRPYWIRPSLALLGYCEFGKNYLRQVRVATDDGPGVNPLRYRKITEDLDRLPLGTKAILYFHWGREHVWLPPFDDLNLARRLLEDPRVAVIVGTHAHRAQGFVQHRGKRAYLCLGNFLFPNFFIEPKSQLYCGEPPQLYGSTRRYHAVGRVTYKKWPLINRISIVVEYHTATDRVSHRPVIQEADGVGIRDLGRVASVLVLCWIRILSMVYRLPRGLYVPLARINVIVQHLIWSLDIIAFWWREDGAAVTSKRIASKIKTKYFTQPQE
jgi:poly-gamma-glutamate synthesis protein (capsule biosynthesis protein)